MKAKSMPIIPIALLIIFCLWFFLFVFADDIVVSQWLALGFGILVCIIPLSLSFVKTREYVGMTTLMVISYGFMVLELVASVIILIIAPQDWKIPFFVQSIFFAVYCGFLVMLLRANRHTDAAIANSSNNSQVCKDWIVQLRPLATDRTLTVAMRKSVEEAYDALRSTPMKSTPQTHEIDNAISSEIRMLIFACKHKDDFEIEDSSRRIESLAQERKVVLSR